MSEKAGGIPSSGLRGDGQIGVRDRANRRRTHHVEVDPDALTDPATRRDRRHA